MTSPLPATAAMLAELIAIPSVSCTNPEFDLGNGPLCARLATFLEDAGCRVTELPVPGHPGKFNLVARFGAGPPGLALCGHTDTVPCDPLLWRSDPFAARRDDQRLYGLGSADMKGFLAVVASVLARLDPATLRREVVIVGSADEESSMSGARALVDAGEFLAPFALVGEPTGMKPVRQHKGTLMEGIRLLGRAGHSSNPALGVNAIDALHAVLGCLGSWREELRERYADSSFDVPFPTLNFGHVRGGDNPNRICGACELHLDLRLMPGMTVAGARAELRRRVQGALADSDIRVEFDVLFAGAEPLSTAPGSALVRACERHSGCTAGSVNFCTEGPLFTQLGAETVIYGPGSIDVAHQPDEYLDLRTISPAEDAIALLVRRFCADDPPPVPLA